MIDLKNYQTKLFPYAYNILGSVDDALDVIQDVMVNYTDIADRNLENETGYLVKSVINKSITAKTQKARNTSSVWLPEPVSTRQADANIEQREVISYSLLILLEFLNPKERAVFILKEAFDYAHEEIAQALSITVENSRKLLSRARNELKQHKEKFSYINVGAADTLHTYVELIKTGNVGALESRLSNDIVFLADGGGRVSIVRERTLGAAAVSDLINYLYQNYHRHYTFKFSVLNHQPAILYYNEGKLTNCQIFDMDEHGHITCIYSVVDPHKLINLSTE